METIKKTILIICIGLLASCSDYLDVVPDNVATIDNAFTNRINAEKYLFTCYSYLPDVASHLNYPGLLAGGESWLQTEDMSGTLGALASQRAWRIARGEQNANSPHLNYWDGANGGTNLFIALRDCNIFLENIDGVPGMDQFEKARWVAEVKFLKAYYHFFLLRAYGPIPIIKDNIPVSADPDEVRVYRDPADDVADYIVELLDESLEDLPLLIENTTQELGRITKPIALALKAQTRVLMASPLFNGNPYYANMKDKRGVSLFSTTEDGAKWELAAEALKDAIDVAHEAGHALYYYRDFYNITDSTKAKLSYRQAITERWNEEIIWGSTRNSNALQTLCAVRTAITQQTVGVYSSISPVMAVVENYYSNNGVPINEDIYYDYDDRFSVGIVDTKERYYIKPGFETAKLNMNREVRFYASLSFDGCMLFGNGKTTDNPATNIYLEMKRGQASGILGSLKYSITGYVPQKLVHIRSTVEGTTWSPIRYAFPYIRLADLYLLYAEALNEMKNAPDEEVYYWIDLVRERASLKGVVESWQNYSSYPDKPLSKSGMRDIIKQERRIELAFEGPNYFDMLRWKDAEKTMNTNVYGWNVRGEDRDDYYKRTLLYTTEFSIKNYFTPIRKSTIDTNPNLKQNYGWD